VESNSGGAKKFDHCFHCQWGITGFSGMGPRKGEEIVGLVRLSANSYQPSPGIKQQGNSGKKKKNSVRGKGEGALVRLENTRGNRELLSRKHSYCWLGTIMTVIDEKRHREGGQRSCARGGGSRRHWSKRKRGGIRRIELPPQKELVLVSGSEWKKGGEIQGKYCWRPRKN